MDISGLSVCESTGEKGRRWNAGLTAAKMSECRWLKPDLVVQFEFVERQECGAQVTLILFRGSRCRVRATPVTILSPVRTMAPTAI